MSRPTSRLILGLESGGDHLSVGLLRVTQVEDATHGRPSFRSAMVVVDEVTLLREQKHRDSALSLVSSVLARHEISPVDLSLIAVGRGPGSFTGIRLGLSLATGLSIGAAVPVWPVCSLAVLALNAPVADGLVMPLIDARKGEVYGALFRLRSGCPELLLAPAVGTCEAVLASGGSQVRTLQEASATPFVLGSGAVVCGVATSNLPTVHIPRGSAAAILAAAEWEAAGYDVSKAPEADPTYLRRPEAELALEGR